MEENNNHNKYRFSKEVIIAIVSVLGSVVVALITIYPNISNKRPVIMPQPLIDTANSLSICDKYKLAIKDVPVKFKHFIGDKISESENYIEYQSKYTFNDLRALVVYDKKDLYYSLEITSYKGNDSLIAIDEFYKNLNVIEACLSDMYKKNIYDSKRFSTRYRSCSYFTEDYEVYVSAIIREDGESETTIDISKNLN